MNFLIEVVTEFAYYQCAKLGLHMSICDVMANLFVSIFPQIGMV